MQLFQPLVVQHQHRIGLNHQPRPFIRHAPLAQFLGREQVKKVAAAVATDPLLRVGRTQQLAGSPSAPVAVFRAAAGLLLLGGLGGCQFTED
jgi:hypothetical protein